MRLDLCQYRRNAPRRFERVVRVLQSQKISLAEAEVAAQPEIGVGRDVARPLDDGVNAVGGHADRSRERILAHPHFPQELARQDFAGMGVVKGGHAACLSVIRDSPLPRRPWPRSTHCYSNLTASAVQEINSQQLVRSEVPSRPPH